MQLLHFILCIVVPGGCLHILDGARLHHGARIAGIVEGLPRAAAGRIVAWGGCFEVRHLLSSQAAENHSSPRRTAATHSPLLFLVDRRCSVARKGTLASYGRALFYYSISSTAPRAESHPESHNIGVVLYRSAARLKTDSKPQRVLQRDIVHRGGAAYLPSPRRAPLLLLWLVARGTKRHPAARRDGVVRCGSPASQPASQPASDRLYLAA